MKHFILMVAIAAFFNYSTSFGGDFVTNTSQSPHFFKNPALGATMGIEGVYYNPAGLIKLSEGFHFTVGNVSVFQTRTATTTFAPFAESATTPGVTTREFKGKTTSPMVPSLYAAYRTGKWAFTGSVSVVGGGGKIKFDDGLPSLESNVAFARTQMAPLGATQYSVTSYMEGSSILFGFGLGGTYQINDMFSAHVGLRAVSAKNGYKGHIMDVKSNPRYAMVDGVPTLVNPDGAMIGISPDAKLDNSQKGFGITPVIGLNFNHNNLNIGMKYELRTKIDVKNEVKIDNTGMFEDGSKTPYDMPALLTVGARYQIIPRLKASVSYGQFFDKDCNMPNQGEKKLDKGTREYAFGFEFDINKLFTVSAGYDYTDYSTSEAYLTDQNNFIDNYSIGIGGVIHVSKNIHINLGYLWGTYISRTEKEQFQGLDMTNVYGRTNNCFAIGVDFSF